MGTPSWYEDDHRLPDDWWILGQMDTAQDMEAKLSSVKREMDEEQDHEPWH